MTQPHFHLLINHLPIFFPVAGLLILITGIFLKNETIKRTAYGLFAIGAIGAFVASSSGEGAEEAIEHIQGVSRKLIHKHEESSEIFSLLSYLFGAISLVAIWVSFKQKSIANVLSILIFVFGLVVLFFAKETGTTGGEIMHSEIRSGAVNTSNEINSNTEED